MAAARAQEASQSSRCTYDVFLSFRGADTRKTFTDGLYTALVATGFRTFRDDDEIERGEHIKSELERAILQSRGSILVVSRNYATSGWCLDELVTILRHKRENGHAVLPIFYHVEPSQVRNQTGSFGKAISTHEKDKEKNWKVEGWRAALREVADMGGMPLRDQGYGHELKFIEKVVKVIEDKVNRSILSIAPYLIGIDSRVKNITPWLQSRSDDVGVLAICGMGGIGKTTIAKYVFDLNFERFECSSFLENIRELSKKANGLVRMQRQLLSDIQVGRKVKIGSVAEGIIKIKDALRLKQALLVLDDVNKVEQLDAVLGMRDCFFPGSKIIVTTRNTQLMKDYGVQKIHNVENMLDDESTELFSWHAFGKYHPSEDYVEISNRVVDHCGGLPLALQVLGSALFGKSVDVWESTLKKLEAIAHSQVVEKLKISYDSLQDEHDRRLFLEITCFFVRKKIEHVITILDECDLFASIGIQNLIDRCLLKVNENNELVMHHLLRDMGREIVRQESPKEPGKRSRLWRPKDSFSVLREKTGSEKVEGLSLEMNLLTEEGPSGTLYIENSARKRHPRCFQESNSSKRRRLGLFSWLPSNIVSTVSFSASNEVTFDTDALSSMRKLRFLQFKNVQLRGGYQQFPCELIWLRWRGFPHKSIPDDFPLNSLVSLELRHSSLEQNWKGTKGLHEFGIFSTCVPGTRIPGRFTNMSTCSEICFRLETLPHLKIKGLNVCVVYTKAKTKADNPRVKFWDELYIRVTNKTKGLKWIYSPTYNGIPDTGENMTWLSHWKIGGQLGGGGNELIISVFLCSYVELKEFGAHVVYDEEEDGDEIVNLSVYQVGRDAYFLCHYDFDIQQKCNEVDDGWNTEGWYEFLFGDSDCTELKPRN